MKLNIIQSHPEIMSGVPVFRGTRVPIQALFDYLSEDGDIESFLKGYPHIKREMVSEVFDILSKRYSKRRKKLQYESFA